MYKVDNWILLLQGNKFLHINIQATWEKYKRVQNEFKRNMKAEKIRVNERWSERQLQINILKGYK